MKTNKKLAHRRLSEPAKKQIIELIEQGKLSRRQAMEEYHVRDVRTLTSWILKYAQNPEAILPTLHSKAERRHAAYRVINREASSKEIAIEMRVSLFTVKQWIKDVRSVVLTKKEESAPIDFSSEQKIEDLQLKVAALETLIDIAEKELKIDIRKKSGTKP